MPEIENYYLNRDFASAVKVIMELADQVNQYIDSYKPWQLIKQQDSNHLVQLIATQGLNAFRILIGYLKPIIPKVAEKSEKFLNISISYWTDLSIPLLSHKISEFTPIITRVEQSDIDSLVGK